MTSRERLLTAMRCEVPDRVPIEVRGVPVWNEAWVRSRHESYRPLIEAVRHWVASWSPPTGRFLSDAPYVPPKPSAEEYFRLEKRLGERGLVLVSLLDPIGHVHDLLGPGFLSLWSAERRELVHVRCHGPLNAVLEEFVVMGANCLHPVEPPPLGDVPLQEAKRRIGISLCLEGNIQIGDLYAMEPEAFRKSVGETVLVGKEGGGFVLCPTASPHTPTLSPLAVQNYLTTIETGVRLGHAA